MWLAHFRQVYADADVACEADHQIQSFAHQALQCSLAAMRVPQPAQAADCFVVDVDPMRIDAADFHRHRCVRHFPDCCHVRLHFVGRAIPIHRR